MIVKRYKVSLEPLSSIHVWGGSEAIIGIDGLIERDEIKIIDFEKTFEKLNRDEVESFTKLFMNRRYRDAYNLIREKIVFKKILKNNTGRILRENDRIKMLPDPVIPGSSLKGYLRTVILNHLLTSMNPSEASKLLSDTISFREDPTHTADSLERAVFMRKRPPKSGGFYDVLTLLSISDPVEKIDILTSIRRIDVIETLSSRSIASIYVEVFERGSLVYDLYISRPHDFDKLMISKDLMKTFSDIYDLSNDMINMMSKDLLNILREFGCKLVENELDKIKGIKILVNYPRFLENVLNRLCEKESECIPARIGFGGGHESKTIALYLKKNFPDKYNELRSFMEKHVRHTWDSLTVKTIDINGKIIGLGWCKICVR